MQTLDAPVTAVAANLDTRIAELAARYLPIAREMLAEAIRIPADYVDKPVEQGGDPLCGLSNHEFPRLEYLRKKIIEINAVRKPEDVFFDDFGNLVWWVEDPNDGIEPAKKKVIYIDGHTDTVKALRSQWKEKVGGVDCYDGLIDRSKINKDFLNKELGWVPPESEWEHLLFGRGSADQLGGVISAAIATKILIELTGEGALKGAIVRSYGTACEEDNDGAGPMYLNREVFPTAGPEVVPDVVILTDGTGCSKRGALGIYRGQRGRMQIEVTVTGKSCHGSMPWEGKNPFEFGGAIVKEAAEAYEKRDGFLDDPFLGHGTRTASWARLDTPSDCAVPERLVFRFDRRLTIGETPEQAVADVERLPAVAVARKAGLTVEVSVPDLRGRELEGLRPQQPADLPRVGHPRGASVHPGRRRRLQGRRQPARGRQDRRGGRPHQGAARRALGLLHGRRRLPGPERSQHPGRRGKELDRGRPLQVPRHARLRNRHRAEHPQDRGVPRHPRAPALLGLPGPVPERLRRHQIARPAQGSSETRRPRRSTPWRRPFVRFH